MPHRRPILPHAQRGAALLLALLTVTLVATLAASALWQQWRAVEVESAERTRAQAAWILTGSLDWARLILREDGRNGGPDHLGEPWAVSLEEARLETFLGASQGVSHSNAADLAESTREAYLSGQVSDQQARLNVLNLVQGSTVSPAAHAAFERLFTTLGLASSLLDTLTENLRFAADTSPDNRSGARAALWPQRNRDLLWLGLNATALAALDPYITVLPARTPVNLNTARAEVIYAVVPGLDLARAERLVAKRARTPLASLSDATQALGLEPGALAGEMHAVASRFFEVRGRLRLDGITVEERSLLQRDGQDVQTLWRDRGVLTSAVPTMRDSSPPPSAPPLPPS